MTHHSILLFGHFRFSDGKLRESGTRDDVNLVHRAVPVFCVSLETETSPGRLAPVDGPCGYSDKRTPVLCCC